MRPSLLVQSVSGRYVPASQVAGNCYPAWDAETNCRFTPVQWSADPVANQSLIVNCLQGVQLSATQRLRADQQKRLQASMSGGLGQLVQSIDKALEQHKLTGASAKPFKQWQTIQNERGTLFLGDVFGFGDTPSCDPLPELDNDWQWYERISNQPGNSALHQ